MRRVFSVCTKESVRQWCVIEFGPRASDGEAAFFVSFASGCAAGSLAALAVNPFDVIKTRLQAIKKAEGELQFNGIMDCIGKFFC